MCPPAPRRWSHQKDFHLYIPQNFCTVNHMAFADASFPHALIDHILPSFKWSSYYPLHLCLYVHFLYKYVTLHPVTMAISTQCLNSHSFHHSTIYTTSTYLIPSHCSHPSILSPHVPFTTSSDSLHLILCSYRFLIHISMSAEEYYSLNLSTSQIFSHFHDLQRILQHT